MRKLKLLMGLAFVGALAAPVVAHADTFAFTVAGSAGGFSGTGTLTAVDMGSYYQITGITGPGITGLIAPGGFNGNDNRLYPNSNPLFPTGGSLVDSSGFSFDDTMGDTSFQVNLFSAAPPTASFAAAFTASPAATTSYFIYLKDSDGVTQTLPVTFSVTPTVPEPSSFVLLGTGALALAGAARRRLVKN